MRTFITVAIAALVVNACVQASLSTWEHYQFVDEVEQEARFGGQKTTSDLHRRVQEIADSYSVPLAYNDISVQKQGMITTVSFTYTRTFEMVPRLYMFSRDYDVALNVYPVRPIHADDLK